MTTSRGRPWTDEHVRAAAYLAPPGPFVVERDEVVAIDEAAGTLSAASADPGGADSAAVDRARNSLVGTAVTPVRPLHTMGGVAQQYFEAVVAGVSEWPDHLFLPGGSNEKWLDLRPCPPDHRYAGSSASGSENSRGDAKTGQAFSWSQVPAAIAQGSSSAGVFAFFRPKPAQSVLNFAPEINWTYSDRWNTGWDLSRDFAIAAQIGGELVLSAWVWDPVASVWDRATTGLGPTAVSAVRSLGTLSLSGSAATAPRSLTGHLDSGQFTVPVLTKGGKLYAFGVHARTWWNVSVRRDKTGQPPDNPNDPGFNVWAWVNADVPRIWL